MESIRGMKKVINNAQVTKYTALYKNLYKKFNYGCDSLYLVNNLHI